MIKRIFYGWWIVLACFLIGLCVGGVVFFGVTAFFEPIREEFGWSYTQISFAASLRGLEMGIFAPLAGFLVDRFGSRKLIFYGVITVGSGLILLSQTQSLVMFYGSFLLIAFGFGWLGDYFDKRYMLAWTFCIMGLGMPAFCYAHVGWAVLLFLLLFSPGHGGSMVLRASILREYFGRDSFGKLIGITMGS